MAPTGPVITPAPWGNGNFGVNWEAVTRYDEFIREAAEPVGWPMERVRAHIMIESQGSPDQIQLSSPRVSYGLMQIVPYGVGWEGWHQLVKEKAGMPVDAPEQKVIQALADPRINILVGVAILETYYVKCGTLDGASSFFFTGTCNWWGDDPISKVTGAKYKETLDGLIAEQGGATDSTQALAGDPLQIIFGGQPTPIAFRFREEGAAIYEFGVGHGTTSSNQHTGLDVSVPYNTPIHSLAAGSVVCVGGNGTPMWGQGCGAFSDTGDLGPGSPTLGVGNITVLQDNGYKITYGHSREAFVIPGERVTAGQPIGTSGGMFGAHSHIEVVTCEPLKTGDPLSCYWLWDPEMYLKNAMDLTEPVFSPRDDAPQP